MFPIACIPKNFSQFSPANLAGLAAWFKSDAGITIGTGVSQWDDQSGNARHLTQATGTKQPAFSASTGPNGLPGLTFDGVDDLMQRATFALAQPTSIYMLLRQVTWTGSDRIYDGTTVNTGALFQYNIGVSPQVAIQAGAILAFISPPLATWTIVTAVLNGVSSTLRLNKAAAVTGDAGASGMGGLTLGADGPAGAFGLFGNFITAEWILRSAADSTAVQNQFIDYLASRGGIAV